MKKLLMIAAGIIVLTGCEKRPACFDPKLRQEHRYDLCTQDCPKVRGCDGEIYCNECIANQNGIRVVPE